MPSIHSYESHELSAPYEPFGTEWMVARLAALGYQLPKAYQDPDDASKWILSVQDNNVSKNQLAFDVSPAQELTADVGTINILPGDTAQVRISGPNSAVVNVKFQGTGYITERIFNLSAEGEHFVQLGPCPVGQFVVEPQVYHFYVAGTNVAPVAVLATFM